MQDDIDWMNASSDFGLIELCREMETLARPVEALASLVSRRTRVRRRRQHRVSTRVAIPATWAISHSVGT